MSKVYVVMSGEYSDQEVKAVFSTKEAAHEFCMYHNPKKEVGERIHKEDGSYWYTPDYRIYEYALDPEVDYEHADQWGFTVFISKDGEAAMCQNRAVAESHGKYRAYFYGPTPEGGNPSVQYPVGNGTRVDVAHLQERGYMQLHNVLARDEKHAIKIANDMRAQLVALNRWPTKFDRWGKAVNVPFTLDEMLEENDE